MATSETVTTQRVIRIVKLMFNIERLQSIIDSLPDNDVEQLDKTVIKLSKRLDKELFLLKLFKTSFPESFTITLNNPSQSSRLIKVLKTEKSSHDFSQYYLNNSRISKLLYEQLLRSENGNNINKYN